MYSSFQSYELAAFSCVSIEFQIINSLKTFFFDTKTEIKEALKTEASKPFLFGRIRTPSPVSVWVQCYIFSFKNRRTIFF